MLIQVKRTFERISGYTIFRTPPAGTSLAADLKRWAPDAKISVIADVGANVGQSAEKFTTAFPDAVIHCFEPGTKSFSKLKERALELGPHVHCHQLALGDKAGERPLIGDSKIARLAERGEKAGYTEIVSVRRLDDVADEFDLRTIDLLKIDAEGHDLHVLWGATQLLKEGRATCVLLEVGLNPTNSWHVPLEEVKAWLEPRGYFLFGFYDQTHEFDGSPQLRRANVAFIHAASNSGEAAHYCAASELAEQLA